MRRALFTFLFIAAAVRAVAAPAAAPSSPTVPLPAAAAGIAARAQVIAASPSLDAHAVGRLLLLHAESGVAPTAGGIAQITLRDGASAPGPALLIEFVAN